MQYSEALAEQVEQFCSMNYGYDQGNRWGNDEVDCSSLIYRAIYAIDPETKLNRHDPRYTGTLYRDLTAIGFRAVPLAQRQRGDVLLNTRHHVLTYLGNGKVGGARIDERGKASGGQGGDQTGREVCIHAYYNYPWDWCLRPPQVELNVEDDIVTDADIQKIADKVWAYPTNGWNGSVQARDRLSGIDYQCGRTDDCTGRGYEMPTHDHVKWIAASVSETNEQITALADSVNKLAKVVAEIASQVDKMYEMADTK